jgi:hypothetical protein
MIIPLEGIAIPAGRIVGMMNSTCQEHLLSSGLYRRLWNFTRSCGSGLGPTSARGLYRRSGVQALAARHPAPKVTQLIQLFVKYITNLVNRSIYLTKSKTELTHFRFAAFFRPRPRNQHRRTALVCKIRVAEITPQLAFLEIYSHDDVQRKAQV